jgi:hypothetical protein
MAAQSAQPRPPQASPPPAAAQDAGPPQAARVPPKQQRKSASQDAAVLRQLELLMLLELMKDYALFYDDPEPAEKARAKP